MLIQFWIIYFSLGMIGASITTVTLPIIEDLNLSYGEMGVILGTTHLIYIPLAIPIGLLIDRLGVRKSILIGSFLVSLSGVLRALSFNFVSLFLSVALMGLGGPTISVGLPKAIAQWFQAKNRVLASGIYLTGFIMGVATATALTNTVVFSIMGSWRGSLGFYGFFGFITTIIWFVFAREKITDSKKTEPGSLYRSLRMLIDVKNIWIIAIIGFSSFFVRHCLGGWLPYILELRGFSPSYAGVLSSIPSWVGLIGSIGVPRASEKYSRKNVIMVLLFVQGITVYLLGTTTGITLYLALIIYGISTYSILPLLIETLMRVPEVGIVYMGVATGLFFSIGEIGGFLGPSMMGFLLDYTGSIIPGILTLTLVVELMIIITMLLEL
jgi:cyanate permease